MNVETMTEAPAAIGEDYGDEYITWKNWERDFGKITKTQAVYYSAEVARSNRNFPEDSKVLEIGFGNGGFLAYARQRNWDVRGTEVNGALVKIAQSNGYHAIHAEDLSLFDDNEFDLIVAFDVLEHIPPNSLHELIASIKRLLKNNGVLIARFPNGDSPFGLYNQNGDVTHLSSIGSGKVHYFANKLGMKVVFVGGQSQPIFGTSVKFFLHRALTYPIKRFLDFTVNAIFFPYGKVAFFASNLVMILSVEKSS